MPEKNRIQQYEDIEAGETYHILGLVEWSKTTNKYDKLLKYITQ